CNCAPDAWNDSVAVLLEPSTVTFATLILSAPVTLYVPAGNSNVSPEASCPIHALIAAVSSVVPFPAAPHSVLTLWMVAWADDKPPKSRKTDNRTWQVSRGERLFTVRAPCCRIMPLRRGI